MSDYICEDLIFEIFTRLPPKSLLRFRSLSKSWYSCISSPNFIHMHTSRSPQKFLIKHLKFGIGTKSLYSLHSEDQLPVSPYIGIAPLEFSCDRYIDIIFGSCNGIVCAIDYNEEHISLWNPSIRRKLTLPECPRRYRYEVAVGFGFDQITDDYKIVIIPNTKYGGIVKSSFVYAVKTGAWCEIAPSPTTPLFLNVTSKACFVNGALHWVVESNHVHRRRIMTFDLSTHVFGMIPLPEPGWETRGLTTIQGSLAMISYRIKPLDSWVWVRRDASWSVLFKSKTNHVGEGIKMVLQLNNNGDLLFKTCDKGLQVYNPQSTLVRLNEDASWLDDIVLCAESLQLLDMGTDY